MSTDGLLPPQHAIQEANTGVDAAMVPNLPCEGVFEFSLFQRWGLPSPLEVSQGRGFYQNPLSKPGCWDSPWPVVTAA